MSHVSYTEIEQGQVGSGCVGKYRCNNALFFGIVQQPQWGKTSLSRVHDHTQLDTPQSVGRLWMSDHPDAETSTYNTHKKRTSIPSAGFEHTISAGERPQTHALDRAATGTGLQLLREE